MPAAHFSDEARREREQRTIDRALKVFERRARYNRPKFNNLGDVRAFLRLRLAGLDHEEFWVVWLDSQLAVIAEECMAVGSITQAVIYPREFVKKAIAHNAVSAILAHNHPGGSSEPSREDIETTRALKAALALVDVRLNDHLILSSSGTVYSFAESRLL